MRRGECHKWLHRHCILEVGENICAVARRVVKIYFFHRENKYIYQSQNKLKYCFATTERSQFKVNDLIMSSNVVR